MSKSKSLVFSFLILFTLTLACSGKAKTNIDRTDILQEQIREIADYKSLLENFKISIRNGENFGTQDIELLVPKTEEEYLLMYSMTNPSQANVNYFIKLDSIIGRNAIKNLGDCLRLYLSMAAFVDGEYAESYFEDVDFVIGKNISRFCNIYENLDNVAKSRLIDYKEDYCN